MKFNPDVLSKLYRAFQTTEYLYRATAYLSPTMVVKLTRTAKLDKRLRSINFMLTVGGPNYAEREFIAKCKVAGEPLPVRKVQFKFYPKPKKKEKKK
jgi:hypothetical protein